MSVEHRKESGLIILRGAVDADLSKRFEAEMFEFMEPFVTDSPDKTRVVSHDAYIANLSLRKLNIVREKLVRGGAQNSVTINYQPPGARQHTHQDSSEGDVVVFHASDGGEYLYAVGAATVEEAEQNFVSIEMSAGDVVIQTMSHQFHAGANGGSEPRITAAFWKDPNYLIY